MRRSGSETRGLELRWGLRLYSGQVHSHFDVVAVSLQELVIK